MAKMCPCGPTSARARRWYNPKRKCNLQVFPTHNNSILIHTRISFGCLLFIPRTRGGAIHAKPHIIIMKSSKESSLEPQCDKFDKFHKSMKPSNGRTSISKTIRKCIRVSIKDFFLNEAKTVYVYSSPAPKTAFFMVLMCS